MRTVGQPVDPLQLVDTGDSLKSVVPGLKDRVVRHIFRLVKFRSRDRGECAFDDAPEHVPNGRWTI